MNVKRNTKQAPTTATVSLTACGKTWTATAKDRNTALALLAKQIKEGN